MIGHAIVNVPVAPALLPVTLLLLAATLAMSWRLARRAHAAAAPVPDGALAPGRGGSLAAVRGGAAALALWVLGGAAFAVACQRLGEPLALASILALPVILALARRRREPIAAPAPLAAGG